MSTFHLNIQNDDVYRWEQKLGKSYSNWSESEKITFLMSMASKDLSALDTYINHLQLGDLAQTPFGKKILELQSMGFRIIMTNDFKYAGMADSALKEAKEIILFHPAGLLYYATSTQEGLSIRKNTDIKRSELYFQASSSSREAIELLSRGSGTTYSDGTFFKSYSGIKNEEIKTILESFQFVKPWNSKASISLLNEADVYQKRNGKLVVVSDDEAMIRQMEKIDQFPEEIKNDLGFCKAKQR